jgi:hypothetical protein
MNKLVLSVSIALSILINGCYSVLQTAEITPPKKFRHTITGSIPIDEMVSVGLGYKLRYGVVENFELDTAIEILWPRFMLGCQYGITKKFAVNTNMNISILEDSEDLIFFGDVSLILGTDWYGGIKVFNYFHYLDPIEFNAFFGKKIPIGKKCSLITEAGIGTRSSFIMRLGVGF